MSLTTSGGFFDTHLRKAGVDSFGHTAEFFDFLNMSPSFANQLVGQEFYIIGTAPWVDNLTYLGFILDIKLRITSNTCGEVGRQGDGFVKRIRMKRLGMAQSSRHSFDTSTGNIVERILFGETPTGCLRMRTERHGFRVFRFEAVNDFSP